MSRIWNAADEEAMPQIGAEVASLLPQSGWIALAGDLGAGKTTLVREIVRALGGSDDDVASPTFAIVHEYPIDGRSVWHLDAYRLSDDPHEWEQIGIPELLSGTDPVLVEWPREEFSRWAPPAARIEIEVLEDESRRVRFEQASLQTKTGRS